MYADTEKFSFEIEEISHPDMIKYWGGSVYRLKAHLKEKSKERLRIHLNRK